MFVDVMGENEEKLKGGNTFERCCLSSFISHTIVKNEGFFFKMFIGYVISYKLICFYFLLPGQQQI